VIVLDTNVISEVMRPAPDAGVMTWLRAQPFERLATTAVSVEEVSYGLCRLPAGRRRNDLQVRFRALLARGFGERILAFDAVAADLYGEIVSARQRTGRPIDAFDAMIAAIARSRAATIATRDAAGFKACGVPVLNPWEA
jgi:predicted nucleic acid-binding protein